MRAPTDAAQGLSLRALPTTLLLVLVAALLFAGSALAVARPGKPTAKAPSDTIASTKPTFTWSKASGAARYEVRVYEGSTLLLKKTGLTKLSWKTSTALPPNVSLTWKVRAGNAAGNGAWSKSLRFTVVPTASAKAITAFGFASPPATGLINESTHTIAVGVPFGTDLRALVATFTTTGASVAISGAPQASGTTANDFTSPVTYTVTAADASTQDYVVTVTVAEAAAVQIMSFAFSPKTLTVKPGQTVVWTNSDPVSHTVTAVDSLNLNAVPTGLLTATDRRRGHLQLHLATPGTFFYECQIHSLTPAMHAQVDVVE